MRILFIGDIVASPGRTCVKTILPNIKKDKNINFVIANVENAAHGRGVTKNILQELISYGIDFFTGGDHVFWNNEFEDICSQFPIIRPANYPPNTPGKGYDIVSVADNKLLIVNLMGRTSFSQTNGYLDDPFSKADEILEINKDKGITFALVDFHAEATSEKYALGFYLDGRINAVIGTHTHVPTCDNFILPNNTMYISDVGMTGIIDSVLGVSKEIIIRQFLTAQNQRFEWESTGRNAFRSVILDTEKMIIERCDQILE